MCQHIADHAADAGSYFSACQACGEVLAERAFVRPAFTQRAKAFAGSAGRWAAGAACAAPGKALTFLLLLCVPKEFEHWLCGRDRRVREKSWLASIPMRFAMMASMQERYPDDPDEVSRRIGLVDQALDLPLSSASFGQRAPGKQVRK